MDPAVKMLEHIHNIVNVELAATEGIAAPPPIGMQVLGECLPGGDHWYYKVFRDFPSYQSSFVLVMAPNDQLARGMSHLATFRPELLRNDNTGRWVIVSVISPPAGALEHLG